MTKLVFETATLADALKKAERIAPDRGHAFDKASGILLEINGSTVVLKSTNLDVYYSEWLDPVEAEGEGTWRLPSKLFTGVVGSLPIGSGKQVTLEQKENTIYLSQNRTKAQFHLMDSDYYPVWSAFDPEELITSADLGGKLELVSWAASKGTDVPLNGIHMDGTRLVATDKYRLCVVPLEVTNFEKAITIPAHILTGAIRQTGEVNMTLKGDQLLIMPDEHTQIRTIVFQQDYPKVDRIVNQSLPEQIKLRKAEVIEIINRACNFTGSDRTPTLRIFIGLEEFAVMMANQEQGLLGDVIEIPGQASHARIEFKFTPKNLLDGLNVAPSEEILIGYDPERPSKIFYIDGGSGYQAWIMPRVDVGAKSA